MFKDEKTGSRLACFLAALCILSVSCRSSLPAKYLPQPDPGEDKTESGLTPTTSGVKPAFFPQGVASPSGLVGYVPGDPQGIVAVDLETGKALWKKGKGFRPLVALDDAVIAADYVATKDNAIRVVAFSADSGKLLFTSKPVVFPEWMVVKEEKVCCRSFAQIFNVLVEGSFLTFEWYVDRQCVTGAGYSVKEHAFGKTRINLRKGTVKNEQVERQLMPVSPGNATAENPLVLEGRGFYIAYESEEKQEDGFIETKTMLMAVDPESKEVLWKHLIHTSKPEKICMAI